MVVVAKRSKIVRIKSDSVLIPPGKIARFEDAPGKLVRCFEANVWHLKETNGSVETLWLLPICRKAAPEAAQAVAIDGGNKRVWIATESHEVYSYYCLSKWRYDTNWPVVEAALNTHNHSVYDCACDAEHNVVAATQDKEYYGNRYNLYKFNSAGKRQWRVYMNSGWVGHATGYGVAVDSSGNVYGVCNAYVIHPHSVYKYNSNGVEQWHYDSYQDCYDVVVDSNGNVYVAGYRDVRKGIFKLNSDGILQWEADTGSHCYGIKLDSSEAYILVAGVRANSHSVWKVDASNGDFLNYYDTGGDTEQLALDGNDNVYVVGAAVGNECIWKLDSSLTKLWSKGFGCSRGYGIDVDADGNIIIAGAHHK